MPAMDLTDATLASLVNEINLGIALAASIPKTTMTETSSTKVNPAFIFRMAIVIYLHEAVLKIDVKQRDACDAFERISSPVFYLHFIH